MNMHTCKRKHTYIFLFCKLTTLTPPNNHLVLLAHATLLVLQKWVLRKKMKSIVKFCFFEKFFAPFCVSANHGCKLNFKATKSSSGLFCSGLFCSISFAPHIALLVLLKTAIAFSLKHHVSLPYNIADLTQLR